MFNILVIGLGILSSFFTFLKSAPMVWDWDFSYFIENSYRVYIGQIPYKDFVLVLTPGTYYIGALIMKIFGLSYNYQIAYIAIISFLTVILTYKILGLVGKNKVLNLLLLLPLLFSGHVIYTFPSYDINAVLFILVGLYGVLSLHKRKSRLPIYFFTGIVIAIPTLFKQNIGLVYFVLTMIFEYIHIYLFENKGQIKKAIIFTCGSLFIFILFILYLIFTHSLNLFLFQAFVFPLQARHINEAIYYFLFDAMRNRSIVYYIPYIGMGLLIYLRKVKTLHLYLLAIYSVTISPLLYLLYQYIRYKSIIEDTSFIVGRSYMYVVSIWYVVFIVSILLLLRDLFIKGVKNKNKTYIFIQSLVILLISLTPFTIHRVESATFGFYPFFALLLVIIYNKLQSDFPKYKWNGVIGIISCGVALFLCIFMFKSSTSKTQLHEIESMITYINKNISQKDTVISIPGQNTFYYLTKRTPPLPYFQYVFTTFPYTPKMYSDTIEKERIDWILIENNSKYSTNNAVMDVDYIVSRLKKYYRLQKRIKGFDIYRRNDNL